MGRKVSCRGCSIQQLRIVTLQMCEIVLTSIGGCYRRIQVQRRYALTCSVYMFPFMLTFNVTDLYAGRCPCTSAADFPASDYSVPTTTGRAAWRDFQPCKCLPQARRDIRWARTSGHRRCSAEGCRVCPWNRSSRCLTHNGLR